MAPTENPDPPFTDVAELLASLAGVLSAHVVTEPGGRIAEIHILSAPDLHPKQVVRNVESALSAGLGMPIDRRIVSVAQVKTADHSISRNGQTTDGRGAAGSAAADTGVETTETASKEPDPTSQRLEFIRYRANRQGDNCTCEVVLRGASGEVPGTGTASNTAGGRAEAAARAVLDGIRTARPELRLELDGATLSSARGRTFVIVAAHLLRDRDTVRLAGAARMTRSPEEAAILAALQATNRWSG